MSGNGGSHPGRSVEFLSRLHDGELDAAERARFESHRAHCAECRRAALEFEDAISLFRSARSTPPRSDLASRILRKVQSTNRPRAPFSPRFGIDLGWAALLVTALLAVLVMTPLVRRGYPRVIPIRTVTAPVPEPATETAPPRPAPGQGPSHERDLREARRSRPRAVAPAPENKSATENRDVLGAEAERPKTGASQATGSTRESPKLEDRRDRGALAVAPEAARAGGAEETAIAAAPGTLKLTFQAIDGYGSPPSLLSGEPRDLPVDERGREYLLLLDSQGIVRRVTPQLAGRGTPVRQGDASAALSRLRFAPGNRPRRLLIRFE